MMWGLVDPRTCHTPLSHLRKVEVRLSPPSVEGATIVLHINNSVFFSRNQLELEARPVLYQRPRNYKQWMPRLAMLHAPLMGRPLWGPGSSPSDSSYTHPFPWTMFIHPASMSRPGSLPHGRLPKTLPSSPGCPHLCPSPYPSLLRGGWVSEHATFLEESGGPTRQCACGVPVSPMHQNTAGRAQHIQRLVLFCGRKPGSEVLIDLRALLPWVWSRGPSPCLVES